MSTTTYTCDREGCNRERTEKTATYRRYKSHFCSVECKAAHQRGAKDRAKDERIRELEEDAIDSDRTIAHLREDRDKARSERDNWKDEAEAAGESVERWKANAREYSDKYLMSDLRRARWKFAAIGSLILLVAVLCTAIWRDNTMPERYHLPTTKPDAGELVIGRQGESRTPHIAYVDSLGVWRDADNGERLEVTKWSRP